MVFSRLKISVCLPFFICFHFKLLCHLDQTLCYVPNNTTFLTRTSGLFLSFFKKFYLFIFRERGREGEGEGEKHQCVVVSHVPPTGDLAHHPRMCLDWELNHNPLVHRPALNPLSHNSQGDIRTYKRSQLWHKGEQQIAGEGAPTPTSSYGWNEWWLKQCSWWGEETVNPWLFYLKNQRE